MNRFRTKKKAKEDMPAPRPSVENESSGPFRMFGKKKAQEEEPKQNIDLTSALPPSDDFRTSLLMNGLSARFSMLREQDDPNSKIGKASDDSVLFPKRQSRLDMFAPPGLGDIAEVESIRAPPFARQESFHSDDAASTSGSVMNRSKPTEGNNLFGGRQKIYKITAGSKANGLPGRALYEDDVALSAFQRWRQHEKERTSLEDERVVAPFEQDLVRPESPPQNDFNRRRETNSTTSSGPSLTRNSTAATSISSNQPKDASVNATAVPSSSSTSQIPERNVTRTRRLYEQGLTQELQDSQTSALSRFDPISKQRPFGVRSPDLTSSASAAVLPERRPGMLSKASAPNLRSFTPPATNSAQMSPAEASTKFPPTEKRPSFGSSPPLSPPASESDEQPSLAIQPNDMGKATAMGVFSRPAQQYDESRYEQRQRQLQQGRETPTADFRIESNVSMPSNRSRSSSSLHRARAEETGAGTSQNAPALPEEAPRTTFLDDSDDEPSPTIPSRQSRDDRSMPRLTLERPNDEDHPALRQSALPTPLSVASHDPSSLLDDHASSHPTSRNISPEDSPTLGPQSGLSGMVRAHLRNASNASSIYGLEDQEPEARYSNYPASGRGLDSMVSSGNPWNYAEHEPRLDTSDPSPTLPPLLQAPRQAPPPIPQTPLTVDVVSPQSLHDTPETDEFARHLADGARRVRERLTSYVDADGGQNAGSLGELSDLQPPQRPSTRSSLKSKSSLGSIRMKESRERSQSRARKMLGIGASTMASAPSPTKSTSGEADSTPLEQFDVGPEEANEDPSSLNDGDEKEGKEENVHAGLKAFRQARRELQRMKELETQKRRQAPPSGTPNHTPPTGPTQERGQPPVSYNSRKQSEEYRSNKGSRAASQASTERDRSGSEASTGYTQGRSPHMRNTPTPSEDRFRSSSPGLGPLPNGNGRVPRPPALSPHSAANGPTVQTRGYEATERSPGLPASPRPGPTTPLGGSFPRRPAPQGATSDSLIDTIGSQSNFYEADSYPATRPRNGSQLNTTASTPNLHGAASAPPLPPINPRRKGNSGAFRRNDQDELTASSPHLPLSPGRGANGRLPPNAYGAGYDDAGFTGRKVSLEGSGTGPRGRAYHNSPPRLARMAPQGMPTSQLPGGMI